MNNRWLFILLTAMAGWIFQTVFLYLVPLAFPIPHWCLLATLALAARGRAMEAMTIGYLWGLALDVYGLTAFGTQGWLLALVAFGTAAVSKELNSEKWGTQCFLALAGTAVFVSGVKILGVLFEPTSPPGRLRLGLVIAGCVLNVLVTPAVFFVVGAWSRFWGYGAGNDRA